MRKHATYKPLSANEGLGIPGSHLLQAGVGTCDLPESRPLLAEVALSSDAVKTNYALTSSELHADATGEHTRIPGHSGIDITRANYDHLRDVVVCGATQASCIDYSDQHIEHHVFKYAHQLLAFLSATKPVWSAVRWINLQGASWDYVHILAQHYELHPLAIQDVVHPECRMKADVYDSQLFVAVTAVAIDCQEKKAMRSSTTAAPHRRPLFKGASLAGLSETNMRLVTEQASLFLLPDSTVISVFANPAEHISQPVHLQLTTPKTVLRECNDASFLLYSLLDAAVNHARPVLEQCAHIMVAFEDSVKSYTPTIDTSKQLHRFQNQLKLLKRNLLPAHILVQNLHARCDAGSLALVSQLTSTYLNSLQHHTKAMVDHLNELVLQVRDIEAMVWSLLGHKSNSIMHTLAVVSTVFLPLTFTASVYGTNFVHPELYWPLGYPFLWMLLLTVLVATVVLLKRAGMLNQ